MITNVGRRCCGCSACEQSCPNQCISMRFDAEGFIRPFVDESRCMNCGKCLRVCPEINQSEADFDPSEAHIWGLRYRGNPNALRQSASGGVFYALAKEAIQTGGHIFGAAFDEMLAVHHIEATDMKDVTKIQNSKYVQSDIGETFLRVRELLADPHVPVVLFSGTPCQCAGLKCFLGNEALERLILVDFVCHGVPSPLLFQKYLFWKEKRMREKITKFAFRTKRIGGWNFNGRICAFMQANHRIYPTVLDPYMINFLTATDYAETCYNCQFATKRKAADITLGDFAGAREKYPEFFSKQGCSIVLTPTEKGARFLERIMKSCDTINVDFQEIAPFAPQLTHPCKRPVVRDVIYKGITELSDEEYVRLRLSPQVRTKAFRRVIRFIFPYRLWEEIKNALRQR